MGTYLGIDFSGGAGPWKAGCRKATVWIARLENERGARLVDLRSVQDLAGDGAPFERLIALLRAGDFTAAAIDAPFSIPATHLPAGGHRELIERVGLLCQAEDRPFPLGAALVELATEIAQLSRKKPYRETERRWIKCGINTRSTLWNGPRGGAAFTAACLTLLARAERPIWPWQSGPGMLVEAFPAAQLCTWRLCFKGYGKPGQFDERGDIVNGLATRLSFTDAQRANMLASPDALDAVVAAFAGIAAERFGAQANYFEDGEIAVLDDAGDGRAGARM